MPNLTVPRGPDDPVRQSPIQTPTVRNAFSAENFGGGRSRAAAFQEAQGISQEGAQIVEEARRRQFILRMDEEKRAIDEWELATLHDMEKGAVSKKGRDVFGLDKQVTEQFDRFVQDREQGLSTDEERIAFRQAVTQRKAHVQGWLRDHIGRQVKVYEAQEFDSGIENAKRMGSLSDDQAAKQLPYMRGLLLTRAKAEGWGPEVMAKELRDHQADLHARVVRRKIDMGDHAGAQAYLEANKGVLADDVELASLVKRKSILGEAQRIRDDVFTSKLEGYSVREGEDAVREVPAARTLKEAIERGRKATDGKDPELQKAVDHQITAEWELRERAEKEAYNAMVDEATQIVAKTGRTDGIPDGLKRTDIMGLEAMASRLRTKTEPVTDWGRYTTLKDMAANPMTRQRFLEIQPITYRGVLSDTEYKEVTGWRAGLLKGDEKIKKKVDGYLTMNGIIGSVLDEAGFTREKKLSERNIIEQVLDDEIKHYRATHNDEDPDNDEVRKKAKLMVSKAKVDGKWLDQYQYKVTKDYLDKADIGVPPEERKAIEEEMKRQGVTPSKRAIVEAWEAKERMKPYQGWLPQ